MRDKSLDLYRALTLIYIVCVIHVAYWLPFDFEPYKGFLLWEMPTIFFIAGASAQYASRKSIKEQIYNRSKRVLIPYYIYAFGSIFILFLISLVPMIAEEIEFTIFDYKWSDLISVLLARSIPGIPMVRHLWFIVPYMLVTVLFCLQRKYVERYSTKYLLLCVFIFICSEFLLKISHINLSQYHWIVKFVVLNTEYFLFYNIFFIAGFLYYKRISKRQVFYILLLSLVAFLVLCKGTIPVMQERKFPPSTIFMFFGVIWLCLLSFIAPLIASTGNRIVERWNKIGYTIYLYQNYAFLIFQISISALISKYVGWNVIGFFVSVISLFVISTLLSYIVVPFEKAVMKITSRLTV